MSLKIVQKPILTNLSGYDIVLFPMGINNAMNRGFSYEIALNFPLVKKSENNTKYGDKNKYGTVHCTKVEDNVFGACYIHNGGYKKDSNGRFVNYEALENCLRLINKNFKNKNICAPILGYFKEDGNGDKGTILKLFEKCCTDIDVTLFDYEQNDYRLELYKESVEAYNNLKKKAITMLEYKEKMRIIRWKEKYGILKPIPDGYEYEPKSKNKMKKIRVTKEMLK